MPDSHRLSERLIVRERRGTVEGTRLVKGETDRFFSAQSTSYFTQGEWKPQEGTYKKLLLYLVETAIKVILMLDDKVMIDTP